MRTHYTSIALLMALAGLLLSTAVVDANWPDDGERRHRRRDAISEEQLRRIFVDGARTLDGSDNNIDNSTWGQAGTQYTRVAPADYADGVSTMNDGPNARYISNRIFNDLSQNLFSENGVTQWAFVWGQFLDHTFGLRETGGEDAAIAFDANDPLESFTNDLGGIEFQRSATASGTGVDSPREQTNTVSSYIDAWSIYGGSDARLGWLRAGPIDGDLSNNSALLLTGDEGYLPRADARSGVEAPEMEHQGRLMGAPEEAVVAGDVRANENIALTATHTLFMREHNRIVRLLPPSLPEEVKFQIARRIVGAELQYITYEEFLPALGVDLGEYEGYDPSANASISNEFAVVGYRGHSMIHGEFEMSADAGFYTPGQVDALEAEGIQIKATADGIEMQVPLNVAFGNPGLVEDIGLEAILAGLGSESQYKNDEQIDNQLRSVLFQVPGPDVADPSDCLDGPDLPQCFSGVLDLAALDIQRGRDHGIPSYNDLREAYGLPRKESFMAITGESTEDFPSDPEIDAADPVNDPDILDFVELRDDEGNIVEPGTDDAEESVITGVRRTTLAARLKAVYGDIDSVDAFVGMVSEPHVAGTEFGELQLAMWKTQFQALRDGDRYFYRNDRALRTVSRAFGITYRHSLADIIALNTDLSSDDLEKNVFGGASDNSQHADGNDNVAPRDRCPRPDAAPRAQVECRRAPSERGDVRRRERIEGETGFGELDAIPPRPPAQRPLARRRRVRPSSRRCRSGLRPVPARS